MTMPKSTPVALITGGPLGPFQLASMADSREHRVEAATHGGSGGSFAVGWHPENVIDDLYR